jgi:hypothetical protein
MLGFHHSKLALLIENTQSHMKEKDLCAWSNSVIFAGDTEIISLEWADPEAINNLCLILKTMLQKSCHKYNSNIKLFVTAFVYIQM